MGAPALPGDRPARAWSVQPHASSVLASASSFLAAACIALAVAACGNIAPLGPTREPGPTSVREAVPAGPPRPVGAPGPVGTMAVSKLGSPIILQVMRSQSPAATGGCPPDSVAVVLPPGAPPMPCYRPVGAPVTITSAGVSALSEVGSPPPGQAASYGFMVAVAPPQVPAVTALIMSAYDSHGALGVSVDGKLWEAPQVAQPFAGEQLQIALLSKNQALQLYHLLVPSG